MVPCSGIFVEDVRKLVNILCQRRVIDAEVAKIVVAADGGANRIFDMENAGDPDRVSEAVTVLIATID